MAAAACTDDEFISLWQKYGSPTRVAKELCINVRSVMLRRNRLAALGNDLKTWNDTSERRIVLKHDEGRIDMDLENGVVIVFSDAHFWPETRTTMQRSLCTLIRQLTIPVGQHGEPAAVIPVASLLVV